VSDEQVLEFRASDNKYLHKDFHCVLNYSLTYLTKTYGLKFTEEFLVRAAQTVFGPLIEKMQSDGLPAMESHIRNVFGNENGDFETSSMPDQLVLRVKKCPAIEHLKKSGQLYDSTFCMSTVVVNQAICSMAGYEFQCKFDTEQACCLQRFTRKDKS
jgi:hypothetical protein